MSDLISRKDAIDAIRASTSKYTGFMEMEMYTDDDAVEAIEGLPSAQPERKRGEWEFYEDRSPVWDIEGEKTWARAYKCSECGFVHTVIEDFGIYSFCPNCGADMREVDE